MKWYGIGIGTGWDGFGWNGWKQALFDVCVLFKPFIKDFSFLAFTVACETQISHDTVPFLFLL